MPWAARWQMASQRGMVILCGRFARDQKPMRFPGHCAPPPPPRPTLPAPGPVAFAIRVLLTSIPYQVLSHPVRLSLCPGSGVSGPSEQATLIWPLLPADWRFALCSPNDLSDLVERESDGAAALLGGFQGALGASRGVGYGWMLLL